MILQSKKLINRSLAVLGALFLMVSINSCEQFELPETGSIEDLTPPQALFAASIAGDYLTYKFDNLSISATDYAWDYGDGTTSTDVTGAHVFKGEGSYTVTLTASDKLGVKNVYTETIKVVKPPKPLVLLPEVLEPGFDKGNDSREVWRSSALFRATGIDSVIQISSTKHDGTNSAKLPSDGTRLGYQVLNGFSANADYVLTYYYKLKASSGGTGALNMAIVKPLTSFDLATLGSKTIASKKHVEAQANIDGFVEGKLEFNSGNNTTLCILFYNDVVELNVDTFSLGVKE